MDLQNAQWIATSSQLPPLTESYFPAPLDDAKRVELPYRQSRPLLLKCESGRIMTGTLLCDLGGELVWAGEHAVIPGVTHWACSLQLLHP